MGACSSCLGIGRRGRGAENPETSRLLYDDPFRSQYGATSHRAQYHQPDPESLRRETEALEVICHNMSDDVVDVFTLTPHPGQGNGDFTTPPTTSANEGAPSAEINGEHTTKTYTPTPHGMMYRSVRAAPSAGHIWRDLNKDPKSWEVAKAVMEGSGDRP